MNDDLQVVQRNEQHLSAADQFNAWYTPHVASMLADWRRRHPIKHHCEPLAAELHTNLPVTFVEYDWF